MRKTAMPPITHEIIEAGPAAPAAFRDAKIHPDPMIPPNDANVKSISPNSRLKPLTAKFEPPFYIHTTTPVMHPTIPRPKIGYTTRNSVRIMTMQSSRAQMGPVIHHMR